MNQKLRHLMSLEMDKVLRWFHMTELLSCGRVEKVGFGNKKLKLIGMNWGRQNAQRLIPSQVVDLLLQNEVPEVRIYNGNDDVLMAFAGSEIGLTLSIFDAKTISSSKDAKDWVQKTIVEYSNTNVRRIYYGNYYGWLQPNTNLGGPSPMKVVIERMMFLHNALDQFGYGDKVKLTIPQPEVILKPKLRRPSDAEFRDDLKDDIGVLLRYLEDNDAPFVFEMFPIYFIHERKFDLSFAFCENNSTHAITDINGFVYTNVFEFMYDSFVWALKKAGAHDLKIVVGQVGWPTDGYLDADISTAERFYKSLLPFVASNKGTPMRPGAPLDIYVHCLTDENKMPYFFAFSRHWGIYRGNGEPKFKIDLSGKGRDMYPPRARGIMRMPERWCVLKGNQERTEDIMKIFEFACSKSDCTSLAPGGSCSQLDFAGNISYAFNMYFQFNFQIEDFCDFGGLGRVVTTNPSTGSCVFGVDVVHGVQEQLGRPMKRNGCKLHEVPKCGILLVLVSTFLALL